jgi:hypothetical protein
MRQAFGDRESAGRNPKLGEDRMGEGRHRVVDEGLDAAFGEGRAKPLASGFADGELVPGAADPIVAGRRTRGSPLPRLPEGAHHGEVHRGRAVESTRAEIVSATSATTTCCCPITSSRCSSCSPGADLAQSQNGHLEADGSWFHYFADLASPACRAWILRPDRNVVSLTGTAHTVAAYRRLPYGWRTTPPGRWADHYMWQQFLAEPWVRATTATRVTAIQFPSHLGREDWSRARAGPSCSAGGRSWRRRRAGPGSRRPFAVPSRPRRPPSTSSTTSW